ncbi:MAG TPA: sel1 repeat family protein [Acinetobacter lwoffii]|uniref:Sel1 repeat family protein n=1 Tax=Acinetobacter lwoffii TaxID=28090 RepID=A0A9D3A081_ACILW|nr:sel1 repeat family protein [Acinetobacter lwoffii]
MKKKLVLAAILAVSAQFTLANTAAVPVDPQFTKIGEMVKANNFKGAYEALNKLASQGNAQAIYNLGYLTQSGQGTVKDEKKAVQLYEQAASKGYPVANYVLGKNYAAGTLGLKQDLTKAKQHLEKASAANFDDATIDLAVLLFAEGKPASDKSALQKLQPLLNKGNLQAIHAKALYDISLGFKNKDEKPVQQGLSSIQDLAKKGYIPALMAVANMFANGSIVPQNLPEAKKIFAALAKENIPQAKESLATVDKMIAEQKKAPAKKS